MASSGSFRQTFTNNGGHDLIIEWTATPNIAGNYSDVTAKLFLEGNHYWSTINSGGVYKVTSITVDGEKKLGSSTVDISGTEKRLLQTSTFRVKHGSNGGKTFNIGGAVDIGINWNGRWEGTYRTSNRAFTLDTIAQKSTISGLTTNFNYGDTIRYTVNAAGSGLTHTVNLSIPGYSGNMMTKGGGGAKTFSTDRSWMSGMPNATSGLGTVKIITYSGSSKTGEVSYNVTVNVPSDVKPSISSLEHVETNPKISQVVRNYFYVQRISDIEFIINSTPGSGAKLANTTLKIDGKSIEGNKLNLATIPNTKGVAVPVEVSVTDTRKREAIYRTTLKIEPYALPSIEVFTVARRKDTELVDIKRTLTATSLRTPSGAPLNPIKRKIEVSESKGTTWTTKEGGFGLAGNTTISGISRTKSYSIRATVDDGLSSASAIVSMSTEKTLLHLHKDLGIGIGKMHEKGVLDLEGEVYLDKGTLFTDENRFAGMGKREAALNLRNGDLVGANAVYIGYSDEGQRDPATPRNGEGILFPRSTTNLTNDYPGGHVVNSGDGEAINREWDDLVVLDGSVMINGRPIGVEEDLLWEGAMFMNERHSIKMPIKIKNCPIGYLLVWSDYDRVEQGFGWQFTILHKMMWNKGGGSKQIVNTAGNISTHKYLYVDNGDTIRGKDYNGSPETNTNRLVLRSVYAI